MTVSSLIRALKMLQTLYGDIPVRSIIECSSCISDPLEIKSVGYKSDQSTGPSLSINCVKNDK